MLGRDALHRSILRERVLGLLDHHDGDDDRVVVVRCLRSYSVCKANRSRD
jgi:hypothetical protein